jgi:hypothetical protein
MPGIFSRLKTWVAGEVLTYSDLNAEFDNLINNAAGDKVDGTSHNLAEMQQVEDPAPSATPDLVQPISITDEIRRLRYAIKRIIGKTNWYDSPSRSLENFFYETSHVFAPSVISTNSIASAVSQAGIYDSLSFSDTNYYDTSITKFSGASLKSLSSSPRYFFFDPGRMDPYFGTFSFWFRNVSANETLLYNPVNGLRIYLNASGYIKCDLTLATASSNTAKTVQTIATGSTALNGLGSFTNVVVSYRIENSASDKISLYVNGTQVESTVNGPFSINAPCRAEYFFLNGSNSARITSSFLANQSLPAASGLGWTKVTTGGTEAVSGGILSLNTVSANTLYYTNTPPATSSSGLWYEFKIKLGASGSPDPTAAPGSHVAQFGVTLRTATDQKAFHLMVTPSGLSAVPVNGLIPSTYVIGYASRTEHDFHQWTTVTVSTISGQYANIYINGVFRFCVRLVTDATAGSLIAFGDMQAGNAGGLTEIEYFSMGTSGLPVSANSSSTSYYSDICVLNTDAIDATTLSGIQTSSPLDLFGSAEKSNLKMETGCSASGAASDVLSNTLPNASSSYTLIGGPQSASPFFYVGHFYSDGKTPITVSVSMRLTLTGGAGIYHAPNSLMSIVPSSYSSAYGIRSFGIATNVEAGILTSVSQVDGIPSDGAYTGSSASLYNTLVLSHSYSGVLPAGLNNVYIYYRNTLNTTVTMNRLNFSATQG